MSRAAELGGPPTALLTRAFVALSAATLVFFIAAGIVLPVVPRLVEGPLGGGSSDVGIAFASFSIAALVMRPVVGWSSDRFGRRPLLVGGAAITVVALLLHLLATDLAILVVARSLLGVGEAFFFVACLAAASDLAPADRRGEAMSFLSLSLYLGIGIGPLIGEALLSAGGFPVVWLVTAGFAGAAVALSLATPETAPAVVAGGPPRARPPLIHPAGLFPGLVILLGIWGMAGYLAFVPSHAVAIGMGGASAPLLLYALVVVGLRIVGARLPDRFGAARLSGLALVLSAAGLAVVGAVPTPAGLLVGTLVFAAGVAFTMPALLALAVSRVPAEERGTVVGTASAFLDVAFGVAPLVLGLIAARTGYGPTFLVSAGLALVGSALLLARRRALAATLVA